MKNNRRLIRISGALLSVSFLISSLGLPVLAADQLMGTEKNETVYIITDGSGKPDSVIVSDWLKNSGKLGTIQDSSNLHDIEVVQGDSTFTGSGASITWNAEGEDVYYQGTSQEELPVGVTMTYFLDGK